ncbi:MAG: sulfonate ABC transporter ATP-binding protein [Candidatus Rokuibacteriota bacterium]|nr:MAG: sulfonate ABC transporter ATP-binding protein [Candidatus Rokubacteria bacterium]
MTWEPERGLPTRESQPPVSESPTGADQILLEDVRKRYQTSSGAVVAVEGVNLAVRNREFVTLLGPSGCGKSTVLGMVGGLVVSDGGRVVIDGEPVVGPNPHKVALVFQDAGLFPWRTALDNVGFGLELQGVTGARRREIARGLLEPMGLRGFEDKYPRELSGGMRQRVAIARALALDTPILLMDEPFGALDEQTRFLMGEWLVGIRRRTPKTVVFVTHSLQEAIALSDRIVVMTARPGRIKDVVEVALPFPRDVNGAEVADLRAKLWDQIREESLKAMDGVA